MSIHTRAQKTPEFLEETGRADLLNQGVAPALLQKSSFNVNFVSSKGGAFMRKSRDDFEYVFVASYWNSRANRRIYARTYGLKAFRIRVKPRRTRRK